ncbi:MAG: hypothetical protein ACFFBD_11705 [Candidatus Hodarchaeota archaeon]
MVEVQDSRPKKFLAIEPRIALKKLLDQKKRELHSLTQTAVVLEEKLVLLSNKQPDESLFWKIALGNEAHTLMNEKIVEAQQEVLIYIESFEVDIRDYINEISDILPILSKLLNNNVIIKLIIGLKDKTVIEELIPFVSPFLRHLHHENLEMRITSTITLPFDVIDNEKVLLKIRNPVKLDEYFAALYVWQKKFATELRTKFLEMWDISEKFDF